MDKSYGKRKGREKNSLPKKQKKEVVMKNITCFLFLSKRYRLIRKIVRGRDLYVYMEYEGKQRCPRCGSGNIVRNGRDPKWRKKLHYCVGRHRIYLLFRRQRYICKECRKSFSESIPIVRKMERHTSVLKETVSYMLIFCPLDFLSMLLGVSRRTLLKIAKEYILRVRKEGLKGEGKIRLGMDAHRFHKRNFAVLLVEISSSLPIALVKDRKASLRDFFLSLSPDVRERIDEVVIDMTSRYRNVIREVLPHARVVCDPFHIISYMNRYLRYEERVLEITHKDKIPGRILTLGKEKLGEEERKGLEKVIDRYSSLHLLYTCKEALRDMYKKKDIKEALGDTFKSDKEPQVLF